MKLLSVFLVGCLFFLSASSGMMKTTAASGKHSCCQQMAGKMGCHSQQSKQNKGCSQPGCAMMFSCSFCGFVPVKPMKIQNAFAQYLPGPVTPWVIGSLSVYHAADWKPPKAC